ncbi:unnamed protein product (macronuclear) [Paramecium tetraurelia]|uniref:Importin N-terminal domain-containing protein n=1 Tax=Paramecium tetraurelia TaxID=5888 RepID=A0CY26_PARTE|nr:uncharacterized protein GSPATT00011325001 [Paramecium tetraurelia]CAK75693.1 unnamed protein product [Paramecium tetraurelia]|eukprot:XP_001443090.1 hypothetical protein (macronuclear) [Paramecium tetraurelia strain d4-2]
MQEFVELIQAAFFAKENNQRSQAEQQLVNLKHQLPNEFFQKCSSAFISPQLDSQTRVAAGTLLQRCITYEQGWLAIGLDVKRKIKDELLSQLISSDQNIKKSAASCLSGICAIELPRQEWPEIISVLVQNTRHDSIEVKKAATITLGYICEALKNQKQSIEKTESEKVLYGICMGLQGEKQIKLISIRALKDSLQFMDQVLAQQQVRDHVTKLLVEQAVSQDAEIRLAALECLIDYTKAIFDYLEQYILGLWNCTQESIYHQDFAIVTMEIWQSIASEINERSAVSNRTNLGFRKTQKEALQIISQQLIQAVLQNLLISDEDEEDDEEQGIQEAAYKAASSISEALGSLSYQLYLRFIENTLQALEWQNRKASLLAFSSMVETADVLELFQFSNSAIGEFIKKLADSHKQVRYAAGRVITRIAENYPLVILKHQYADDYINQFSQFLQGNTKLTKYLLWTLVNLTEAFRDDAQNQFGKYYDFLISQFAAVVGRQDFQNGTLLDIAWVGIINCLQCVKEPQKIKTYLEAFGQQMLAVYSQSGWQKEANISGLLSAIHICFLRLVVLGDQCDIQLMNNFYQLIVDYFKKIQTVTQDGFYAISAIAQYSKINFKSLLEDFMQNYLEIGLQKKLEIETFKGAILCLADIARSLQFKEFSKYLRILEYLITCVNDQQVNRVAKIALFVCIADIVLIAEQDAEPYFQAIWQLVKSGFGASIYFTQNKDMTQLEYYENLNDALLNCYLCMLHAFNLNKVPYLPIYQTIQELCMFIQATSDKSLTPTVEYIRLCVTCLLDCVAYYKQVKGQENMSQKILTSPLLISLLDMLKQYSNQQENQQLIMYANDLCKSFQLPQYLN